MSSVVWSISPNGVMQVPLVTHVIHVLSRLTFSAMSVKLIRGDRKCLLFLFPRMAIFIHLPLQPSNPDPVPGSGELDAGGAPSLPPRSVAGTQCVAALTEREPSVLPGLEAP